MSSLRRHTFPKAFFLPTLASFALLGVLACNDNSTPTEARPTPANGASLSGEVIVSDSYPFNPIAGAVVSTQARTTTTGADGTYAFPELGIGECSVMVQAAGYKAWTGTILLAPGANTLNPELDSSTAAGAAAQAQP
jgi:hypothetical protein